MAPRDRLDDIKRGMSQQNMSTDSIRQELEKTLDQGVKDGKVPHAVVYATNADGSFEYHYQTGVKSAEEPVFMMASCTKLLTSVAALQAVEQGLFNLDEDLRGILPEISKNGILKGLGDDGKPVIEDVKNPITLRHLITHTSGASYPMFDPNIIKLQASQGIDPVARSNAPTVLERFDAPMMFQPGESWAYSPGLDWVGVLFKRKTNDKYDLEAWFREYILSPLSISKEAATFWPDEQMRAKVPGLMVRDKEGNLIPNTADHINSLSTDCFGGHGLYATLSSYLKVQRSLLANDGKLLKPETIKQMFSPQFGEASHTAFNTFIKAAVTMMPGDFNTDIPGNYGLGGLLFEEGEKDRRKKGTLSWSGLFNCFWIIDRESGIAYTFGTQVLPPGDPGCKETEALAERAVYKMAGVKF